jgi:hypothetical protein
MSHRNGAGSPGGVPRRVFRCATALAAAHGGFLMFAEKQEKTGKYRREHSHSRPAR